MVPQERTVLPNSELHFAAELDRLPRDENLLSKFESLIRRMIPASAHFNGSADDKKVLLQAYTRACGSPNLIELTDLMRRGYGAIRGIGAENPLGLI